MHLRVESASNKIDKATVQSIISIAKVCNKKTIAEFVDSKEISDELRKMGIDFFQGYYFSKPQPINNLLQNSSNDEKIASQDI